MSTKIIACSYNDVQASDFSRYTRDTIQAQAMQPHHITHADIFPKCQIKHGNASHERWALEGQYFNYLGAGVGGSITGKGGDILIADDLVKDAYEAYNKLSLDKKWLWYTGTFQSRGEQFDEFTENLEIMNGTRWAKGDPCGRILDSEDAENWYVIEMEAMKNGVMLCPSLLNFKKYIALKQTTDSAIFQANYHQHPIDIKGKLYTQILTYTEQPHDADGNPLFSSIDAYTDTADTGKDFLCTIIYGVYKNEAWILDVVYTKEGMEITEPQVAVALFNNAVNVAHFEGNNGGSGYARAVRKELVNTLKSKHTRVRWFHQSKNKEARILSNSNYVMKHIYMPHNWKDRWPAFFDAITAYQKEGGNEFDDAPDALTGVAEKIDNVNVAKAGPKFRR